MPVIQLTNQFIKGHLICPVDKSRIEFCDSTQPGLYIEVRRTTPKQGTFYLRYKNRFGKTSHQRLGLSTEVTLQQARSKARILRSEISSGNDPKIENPLLLRTVSSLHFINEKYLPHALQHKRSVKFDRSMCKLRIIPKFGHLALNQLTRQDIQLFHSDLSNEGLSPAYCDHHLKLIRHALNLAVDWELLEKNPAGRIQLFRVDNRVERLLSDRELNGLLHVLKTDDNRTVCSLVIFLLSTGARLNEALKAKWSHINQANKVWKIPARNSKSKRIRSVPLNASAIALLQQLSCNQSSEYLFVSSTTGDRLKYVHKTWDRLRKKAGLPKLRLHDCRHRFASSLVNNGFSLHSVMVILGHSSPVITNRYIHMSTKALQDAADSASLQLEKL